VTVLLTLAIAFVLSGWVPVMVLLAVMVVIFGCVYDG